MIDGPDAWGRYTFTGEHFDKIKAVNPDVRKICAGVKERQGIDMDAITASEMLGLAMIQSIQTN